MVPCKPIDKIIEFVKAKTFYIDFGENFYDMNDFDNEYSKREDFLLNPNWNQYASFFFMEVHLNQDRNFYFDLGYEEFETHYQQDPSQYNTDLNLIKDKDLKKMEKNIFLAEF